MSLPFEVNPRLPTGPQSLELPEMKTATFSSPRQDSYSEGKLDHPLTAVSRVPPRYPYRAKRMKIEGWVKIRFVVNTDGRVEQVTILDQDPEGVFERPVRRCVTKWRFEPGTVEGVEVKTVAETTIRFDLE
jgi:protein TonB